MAGRNFSISLGVNHYSDPLLGELSYAESDARTIYELARDKLRYGDRAILLAQSTNSVEFMKQLSGFVKSHAIKVQDRVVLYFAGHGMQSGNKDHLLLLSQAQVTPLRAGRETNNDFLSVRALLDDLDQFYAEFVLVLDACRQPPGTQDDNEVYGSVESTLAGLAAREIQFVFEDRKPAKKSTQRSHAKEGARATRHLIVNSCGDRGRAHEVGTLGKGLFAGALSAWMRESAEAGRSAVIDRSTVNDLGQRMQAMAEGVGIQVRQEPWISDPKRGFVLYIPSNSDASCSA